MEILREALLPDYPSVWHRGSVPSVWFILIQRICALAFRILKGLHQFVHSTFLIGSAVEKSFRLTSRQVKMMNSSMVLDFIVGLHLSSKIVMRFNYWSSWSQRIG